MSGVGESVFRLAVYVTEMFDPRISMRRFLFSKHLCLPRASDVITAPPADQDQREPLPRELETVYFIFHFLFLSYSVSIQWPWRFLILNSYLHIKFTSYDFWNHFLYHTL